uniref:Zinc finger BED domain-containing protein RICESLEEPER 2-like n=1 Tax=Tanacetum cinerariifolium TaxID=118510 RepID=A0A699KFW8_TANCI|nr:zinc finger BED domain-containing protein RICESLEEPER 2-like [Tanacetum cinerariifolium]
MGPEEFTTFDILAWWKGRESQFFVLAAMTRDLLSVQASTTASKSAFSTSGRDHLDAAERIQHISSLVDGLDYQEQLDDVEVETGFAISLSDEEIALYEAVSEARSSKAEEEEEDLTLEEALISTFR